MKKLLLILMLAVGVMGAYKDTVLSIQPDRLIQYLMLNEATGTGVFTAYDSSGNSNDGSNVRTTVAQPGISATDVSVLLNPASSAYINGTAANLTEFNSSNGTISLWANSNDWTTTANHMLFIAVMSGGGIYSIYQNDANGITFRVNNTYIAIPSASKILKQLLFDDTWVHMAATWETVGAVKHVKFYINGINVIPYQVDASGTFSGTLSSIHYGAHFSATHFFDGNISHIATWDTCLSKTEIKKLAFDRVKQSVLCFGDSWTLGLSATTDTTNYVYLLGKKLKIVTINMGRGSTCLQKGSISGSYPSGYEVYRDSVLRYTPDYFVGLYGLNDVRRCEPDYVADTFYHQYKIIIDSLKQIVPAKNIVVGGQWASALSGLAACYSDIKRGVYTDSIIRIAYQTGVAYADIYNAMLLADTNAILGGDLLHPNDSGHAVIANAIYTALHQTPFVLDSVGIRAGFYLRFSRKSGVFDSVYFDGAKATIVGQSGSYLEFVPASTIWAARGTNAKHPVVFYYSGGVYEFVLSILKGTISANGRVDIGISTGL